MEWTEVTVTEVLRGQRADREEPDFVMILAERDGDRTLHVWIGPAEAKMLAIALESVETPRPFAYKLAAGLVEAAGSRINEVRITRLTRLDLLRRGRVESPAGPREVDARPSDAVNLAVGTGAPIRVNTELFGTADEDGDQVTLSFQGRPRTSRPRPAADGGGRQSSAGRQRKRNGRRVSRVRSG